MPKKRSEWKDPNRPKRPISAFLAFSKEKYQEVKKEQPDFNPQEVGREMGVRWKALTPEEKRRYEELACADRMRYEVEMLEYIPTSHEELSDPEEEKQRKKSLARKAKSQRDPLLPQRAQTSWFFFSSEKRPLLKQEFPNIRITEMSKKISEMWRAMDNEAKKVAYAFCSNIYSHMRNVHKGIKRDINRPWKRTNQKKRRRKTLKSQRSVPKQSMPRLSKSLLPLLMMRHEDRQVHSSDQSTSSSSFELNEQPFVNLLKSKKKKKKKKKQNKKDTRRERIQNTITTL
eukprot:TRINITY_DN3390_c0_g1_i1.p1 TRINITY_DN3390_c0_g1~~TRINITY_DN3390_c0_g1_i1.p1  ORF type:complete len:287 (+),score=18.72 TRINITY_DN3390_c0_g1_i1:73-933(+)